jgi:hypothetical protein
MFATGYGFFTGWGDVRGFPKSSSMAQKLLHLGSSLTASISFYTLSWPGGPCSPSAALIGSEKEPGMQKIAAARLSSTGPLILGLTSGQGSDRKSHDNLLSSFFTQGLSGKEATVRHFVRAQHR